ncbi:hypothetical protein SLEP1_g48185 [Rubroshorea leprosula]|uniref:Uncharacterized protein n=1 Tax=Rubroshorea leprosula TaxID=152421 RepID=A0AAV5LVT9_9ROSI|nr:hypothetical protein SLEP1_g48185 [Rubroshorea leprosula]
MFNTKIKGVVSGSSREIFTDESFQKLQATMESLLIRKGC